MRCCVYGCKSERVPVNCDEDRRAISFHLLPQDEFQLEVWKSVIPTYRKLTKYSKICSLHFKKEDFAGQTMSKSTLRKSAVPSLFKIPTFPIQNLNNFKANESDIEILNNSNILDLSLNTSTNEALKNGVKMTKNDSNKSNDVKCQNENVKKCDIEDVVKKYIDDKNQQFECNDCNEIFDFKSSMKEHIFEQHPNIKLYCISCDINMTSSAEFLSHDKIVHNNERQFCYYCKKIFLTKQSFDSHMKRYHNKKSQEICTKCFKKFPTKLLLNEHMYRNHPDSTKTAICGECNKVCKSNMHLHAHKRSVHPENPWQTCSQCERIYKTEHSLRRHFREAHLNLKYQRKRLNLKCDLCERVFPKLDNLKRHIAAVHEHSEPLKCEFCGHYYKNFESLRRHSHNKCSRNVNKFSIYTLQPNETGHTLYGTSSIVGDWNDRTNNGSVYTSVPNMPVEVKIETFDDQENIETS